MQDRVMTTRELAEYIKLNEKTVIKMAQNGEIPGVKIGSQWRFHLDNIDAFLQKDIVRSSDQDLDRIIQTGVTVIPLSRMVDPAGIILDSAAKSADEVLVEFTRLAGAHDLTPNPDLLLEELRHREALLSTAVGKGVAVPHPRHPSSELFTQPHVMVIRTAQGVDFDAPDGQPVRLFFMTCAPSEFVHLRMLAKISKLLHAVELLPRLMTAGDPDQMMRIFLEYERQEFANGR